MSGKKQRYSLEKHNKTGIELQKMRDVLCKIATDLGKAYTKKVANLAVRPIEQIDKLRCELDNIVCRENPEHKNPNSIYYRKSKKVG